MSFLVAAGDQSTLTNAQATCDVDGAMCCLAPKLETPEARGVASLDFRKETTLSVGLSGNEPTVTQPGRSAACKRIESLSSVYPAFLL